MLNKFRVIFLSDNVSSLKGLIFFLFLYFISSDFTFSQETIVKGRVTDAESGEPLPFASVFYNGTTIGTGTDFDGFYTLKTNNPGDSLTCSFFGYATKVRAIKKGITQTIDFQL